MMIFVPVDVETIAHPDREQGKDLTWNALMVAFGGVGLVDNGNNTLKQLAPIDCFCCENPEETIKRAWQVLKGYQDQAAANRAEIALVGYNITSFDLPVLTTNFDLLGLPPIPMRPPIDLMNGYNATPFHPRMKPPKLKALFERHKIEHLEGFDGGMVSAAWAQGEYKLIAEYQESDVRGTVELLKKVYGYFGKHLR